MTVWGIKSRHVKRASYVILTLLAFFEFPMLYYIYQTGTIVYMILAMVAIATFLPTSSVVLFGGLAFVADIVAVLLAYFHPMNVEKVTSESALSSTICSLVIVLCSVFTITILLNMQQNLPEGGIEVRFGGEEFMLILPDVSEDEIRQRLAKRRADYKLFGKQKKQTAFTFSCGVEKYTDSMDVSDVYRQADEKLYQAKERGRDCVIFEAIRS
jgi:hypothetical protein